MRIQHDLWNLLLNVLNLFETKVVHASDNIWHSPYSANMLLQCPMSSDVWRSALFTLENCCINLWYKWSSYYLGSICQCLLSPTVLPGISWGNLFFVVFAATPYMLSIFSHLLGCPYSHLASTESCASSLFFYAHVVVLDLVQCNRT